MADQLKQALRLLRTAGPQATSRAFARRMRALLRLPSTLRQLRNVDSLESAVARVTGEFVRPGDLIFAMQKPAEILGFLKEVSAPAPGVVVEIGTAAGGVLYLLSRIATPDALVISIDLPGGAFGGGYAAWRKPVYRRLAHRDQRVVLVRGSSHDDSTRRVVDAALQGRSIDLLFIDGDHSLGGARNDLEHFGARVRSGGRIAFHDIQPNPLDPQIEVPALWRELSGWPGSKEFVDGSGSPGYGIGLLTRPDSSDLSGLDAWKLHS